MVRETVFHDVFDSQASFRALLDAMSRPGRIVQLPDRAYSGAPPGFSAHSLSLLKSLCDHRVSFHVGNRVAREEWVGYLQVNLSTPLRPADEADYVLLDAGGRVACIPRTTKVEVL